MVFFELLLVFALIFGTVSHSNAQQTAAKPIEWKFQAMWPPGIELKVTEENLTNMINKLSRGRLKIRLYPGGALVKGSEVFDAVSKGVIDAGGDVPQYWAGINTVCVVSDGRTNRSKM